MENEAKRAIRTGYWTAGRCQNCGTQYEIKCPYGARARELFLKLVCPHCGICGEFEQLNYEQTLREALKRQGSFYFGPELIVPGVESLEKEPAPKKEKGT